ALATQTPGPARRSARSRPALACPEPYRARRIIDLLMSARAQADHRMTPDDSARMQADTVSLHARTLLPMLLSRVRADGTPDQPAIDLLRRWNGDAAGSSVAAAIFSAWFHQLAPVIAGDDLGPLLTDRYKE